MMDYNDEKIIVYVMQSIFSLVGTIGNSLVLYIYLKKKDKSTSSIFILALAGADFFTCLVIVPFNIVTVYLNYKHGLDVMCRLYMFLITGGVPYATLIMVAIAFDRYFCICHPFLHVITIFRAKLIIFILLGFAGILGVMVALMYGINDHVPVSSSPANTSCSFNSTSLYEAEQCNTTLFQVNNSSEISHHYDNEYGMCAINDDIFNEDFILLFSKIHAILYLIMFTFVVVLYSLIYREIHVRRERKAKRKRSSLFPSQSCAPEASTCMAETQLTLINVPQSNGNAEDSAKNGNSSKIRKIGANLKEKQFYANIRTAAMLFIVTIVFLIAFLPALLMTQNLISFNIVIFYTYFVYNTANPVIYSFMNKSFRTELKNLYGKVCKNNRKHYR